MKMNFKNQLDGVLSFCVGMNEYKLNPGEEIEIEVSEQDCMYLDQLDVN